MNKVCPKCCEMKEDDQFYMNKNGRYQPYCKMCSNIVALEWRDNHRERFKEIQLEYYHRNKKRLLENKHLRYIELLKDPEKLEERRRKIREAYYKKHGRYPVPRGPNVKRDVKNMSVEELRQYWRDKRYDSYWRGRSPSYGKKPRS